MRFKNLPDEQLMVHVKRRNTSAFDVLYDRYSSRLLQYFVRMVGDRDRAEDLLQDLFMKIVHRSELYDHTQVFSTWIYSIAHNLCKNEYRRVSNSRVDFGDVDEPVQYSDLSETIDAMQFRNEVMRLLDELDIDQRTTFLLRYQEDFSIGEIGIALGCPEGTVKSRLHNITKRLSQALCAYNPYE